MRAAAGFALILLAGCSGGNDGPTVTQTSQDLESAAIARGVIRDPSNSDPVGLYHRDTDRICVVEADNGYRLGAFVDYGDGITCSASGSAERDGETLHVDFGDACTFDARFDGRRIAFPGALPEGCARWCRGRAALSGLDVARLSGSQSEASALRDSRGRMLCDVGSSRR